MPTLLSTQTNHQKLAEKLLLFYGRNSFAWQILNQGTQLWFSQNRDAVVGYVRCGNMRIVGGSPITDIDNLKNATDEFEEDARRHGERVCYFGAQTRMKELFLKKKTHRVVLLGAQPAWDPRSWDETLSEKPSVRELIRYALRQDVLIEEIESEFLSQRSEYRQCVNDWLETRKLPKLQFLMNSDIFNNTRGRRFFSARQHGELIGFLSLAPIAGRQGWLIEQIFRGKRAIKGMNELLIDTVMRVLAGENSAYVTLGLAPLSRRAGLSYAMNPAWIRAAFKWLYGSGCGFYNFSGLDVFKSKFKPHQWEPVYAIVNKPRFSPRTCYRIAEAFCRTSPALFAVTAAIRTLLNLIE